MTNSAPRTPHDAESTEEKTTKFCRDCRHYSLLSPAFPGAERVALCGRSERFDLVSGAPMQSAQEERANVDGCGPDGKHFEAQPWTGRVRKGPNGELIPTLQPYGTPGGCALLLFAPLVGVLAALLWGGGA